MLRNLIAAVRPVDAGALAACAAHWQQLTKPLGALGRLEDLAARLAAIAGTPVPAPGPRSILVFAGDHGVAATGVSAYPQSVTVQMLQNMRSGGAAINVLARQAGATLWVTDVGSLAGPAGEEADLPPLAPGGVPIRVRRVRAGTGNIACGPAMSRAEAAAAMAVGAAAAAVHASVTGASPGAAAGTIAGAEPAPAVQLAPAAVPALPLVALGELGIANTTVAAALAAALTGLPAAELVGAGTGVDDATLRRKIDSVERALAANCPDPADPLGCVAAVGGLEFAAMTGAVLGAAAGRAAVILDGLSATVAALAAVRLCPAAAGYLVAGTRSPEPGQGPVLAALGAVPLLDLGLRLGEASGAALALPLVASTLALGAEMATFAGAGVAERSGAAGGAK